MIKIGIKNGTIVHCEYCGAEIYKTIYQLNRHKHHYCSNICQALKKREITFEHRKCEICGEDMYVSKKSTKRFCSDDCQNIWQRTNTGYRNPKFQGGVVKCENCGEEILLGKYKFEASQHHFCCTECRQEWYANVWSQNDEWKAQSRKRAANLLKNNPVITMTKPQIAINSSLDKLSIQYCNEEAFDYYSIDNYLPKYNLAIEVMGDYWHTSPLRYTEAKNDKQRNIISRDKAKHTYIKRQYDIEILYLWEGDINTNLELCEMLIQQYVDNNGNIPNYHSFNYEIIDGELCLKDKLIIPHQEIAC